jgi:hypothetical protein
MAGGSDISPVSASGLDRGQWTLPACAFAGRWRLCGTHFYGQDDNERAAAMGILEIIPRHRVLSFRHPCIA